MSSVIENLAPTQNANNVLGTGYVKARRIFTKEYDLMIEKVYLKKMTILSFEWSNY